MSRRALLAIAIAVVCVTNIGALARAALNRGAAAAELTLTERELGLVWTGSDTTATWLRIAWTQAPGHAEWASCGKLASLGFSCDAAAGRQSSRAAFVVLEYDGPAWQAYRRWLLQRADEAVKQNPRIPRQDQAAIIAGHSRLMAVDVGADADDLRARYPDRRRYIITSGRVSVYWSTPPSSRERPVPAPAVAEITPDTINVPRPYSLLLSPLKFGSWPSLQHGPRYDVTIRYGRFHEPWIVNVAVRH